MDKKISLFRKDVMTNRADRLFGQVILSQPLSTRLMVSSLLFVCSAAMSMLLFGHYSRTETASGVLVTDAPLAKIVPATSGVLGSILVREGSIVRKGDMLATILLDRAIEGEAMGAAGGGIATIDERMAIGRDQIRLSQKKQESERDRLTSMIQAANSEIKSLSAEVATQRQIIASSKSIYEQLTPVVERGFVSKNEYERQRQAWLVSQQALDGLQQQIAAQKAQAEQAQAQLFSLPVDTAREVGDVRSSIEALAQQRVQLQGERAIVVNAPISGRITALQANLGSSVTSTLPIMTIAPMTSPLRAEVYAPSRAIGFIRPGQEARLLYDAFPFQQFGSYRGRIMSVSRTVIDPREALLPVKVDEPVYRVVIQLDRQQVDAFGRLIPLQPGMALQATIVLDRETFLDWLLFPFRAVTKRS